MIVSIDNLKAGLRWWTRNWGSDFLNAEYYDIYDDRRSGPTDEWWEKTVERLGRWRAYRSPKPPNTKAEIERRGRRILDQIKSQYKNLTQNSAIEPSIVDYCWDDIEPLFLLASTIKPKSPVFIGKLCHFLFPGLFIVMDNLATSVFFDYEFYWRGMKDEWSRLQGKGEAKRLLCEAIDSEKTVHPRYPWVTKIMELSHIGYKHG